MSSNLRNKKFVFRNEQLSETEFKRKMVKIYMGDHNQLEPLKAEYHELIKKSLHRYANLVNTTNSTGDNLSGSTNCHYVFDSTNQENVKYTSTMLGGIKDSYDLYASPGGRELLYEGLSIASSVMNCQFFYTGPQCSNSQYFDFCIGCTDVFGCAGLKKKQYWVFNKPYSKEAYISLREKIIKHMNDVPWVGKNGREYRYGEFFPIEHSVYTYNETTAAEYMPLSKDEALARGYTWRDPDPSPYKTTVNASDLPADIREVKDSIIKEVIRCHCERAYRILPQELAFLRTKGIALPRECQDCRHKKRVDLRNPRKLWHRKCMCSGEASNHFHASAVCPNEFETSYAPVRKEIVYCEQCYQSEVI